MNADTIHEIVENQRAFFRTGETLDTDFRLKQLQKLKEAVIRHCSELECALNADLGRAPTEAYFCDIGSLLRPDRIKQIQSPTPGTSVRQPLEIRACPLYRALSIFALLDIARKHAIIIPT